GEPIAIHWTQFQTPRYYRNYSKIRKKAILCPGIEPETLCSFIKSRHIIAFYSERVGRGAHFGTVKCTPTFHNLCCKSHVMDSVLLQRNFRKTENCSEVLYLPDPGIEPETPSPAVALATTRSTRQIQFIKLSTSAKLYVKMNMIGGSQTHPQQHSIAHLRGNIIQCHLPPWARRERVPASYASHAPHATDFSLSCIETHTIESTDSHRTHRIISNAYMRRELMTSYGIRTMRALPIICQNDYVH
ncbi:hypothetical protein SFRURICE_011072, partial [Spodoptera frugiperda]